MARTLADAYRRFGEADAAGTSPLYERVAVALSASAGALRAIEAAPNRKRQPALILAALHDLALAGRAPDLAAAYASGDPDKAAAAAVDVLIRETEAVVSLAVRRSPLAQPSVGTGETGRCAVLYPAIAEAARRADAYAIGLIDVGCGAALNLNVDRVSITYDDGRTLGAASPVRMAASMVGKRPVPATAIPAVVARVGVDLDPLDVTDADDVRWLRACVWPDQREQAERLNAEIALAASAPPELLRGSDVLDLLGDALARIPADALPVVLTTWSLSRWPVSRGSASAESVSRGSASRSRADRRERFREQLARAGRPVAWVSVEGVGVAPGVPTLGDRPASGHSIIGLSFSPGGRKRGAPGVSAADGAGDDAAGGAVALGRCWLRGRMLEWLGP